MSYPTTGHEVYVSLNLSNTMLTGIGKGTITREEVSASYLKRLFAEHGVIVSAKPEQRRLLEIVNERCDLELEIPEIADGIVMIKSISREPGVRCKVAVYSRDEDVDPVGACIGNHGMRIAGIVDELRGEKVEVIKYSEIPEEFIAAALAPARVESVELTGERACRVAVDPDQRSLAIGRQGINARLAAILTGYKIDIQVD